MNETELAAMFSHALDHPDGGAQATPELEPLSAELALAQQLRDADFSEQSTMRWVTRAVLLNKSDRHQEKEHHMTIASRKTSWALAGLMTLMLIFAVTPLGATASRFLQEAVERWAVGRGTAVVSVEGDFIATTGPDGLTEIAAAEASELPEIDIAESPFEETHLTVEQIQAQVSFQVAAPSYLPDGYVFNNAWADNPDRAYVEYFKPMNGLIGLMQTRLGERYPEVQVTASADIPVQNVSVRGQDGLWLDPGVEMRLLVWEEDGINYQLSGSLASLDEALRIADSLK